MTEAQRKAKAAAHGRAWHWRNRDKALAKSRLFRQTHKAYVARKAREYRIKHRIRLNRQARVRARLKRLLHPKPRTYRQRKCLSAEERAARRRQYYNANRDHYNAKRRALYWLKRDNELERGRLYRQRNRTALRARGRARYWRCHEQSLEWSRLSYARHKAKRQAGAKRYRTSPLTRPIRLAQKRRYYERKHGRRSPEWRARRKVRAMRKARTYARLQAKQLTSAYVRTLLCRGTNLKPTDFSPEIVRVARAKLRLLRAARNKLKEKQNGKHKKHDRHPHTAG